MALGLGTTVGCSTSTAFVCTSDAQCGSGRCEPNGACSFPSESCASGWAYGELSAPGLGGTCVEDDASTGAGTAAATSAAADSGATGEPPSPPTTTSTTTYGYGPAESGYVMPEPPPLCVAYAALVTECTYGKYETDYLLDYCGMLYAMAVDAGSPCFEAYVEYLACLSSLDCQSLMTEMRCVDQDAVVDEVCPPGVG